MKFVERRSESTEKNVGDYGDGEYQRKCKVLMHNAAMLVGRVYEVEWEEMADDVVLESCRCGRMLV